MKRKIDRMEDHACPYCGRFYFMPDEELLGMRHAPRYVRPTFKPKDTTEVSVTIGRS